MMENWTNRLLDDVRKEDSREVEHEPCPCYFYEMKGSDGDAFTKQSSVGSGLFVYPDGGCGGCAAN